MLYEYTRCFAWRELNKLSRYYSCLPTDASGRFRIPQGLEDNFVRQSALCEPVDLVDFQESLNCVKLLAALEIQCHRFIMGKVPSNSTWSGQLLLPTVFAALEHQVPWHA